MNGDVEQLTQVPPGAPGKRLARYAERCVAGRKPDKRNLAHVRTLMANADEAFVVVDHTCRVRVYSEPAERMLGRTRADVIGHDIEVIDAEGLPEAVRGALEGRKRWPGAVVLHVRDRVLSCRATRFDGADGPGVAVVLRDDTDLVEAQERAEAILAGASDGIVVFAPDDLVTYMNPAAAEMLGPVAHQAVGKTVSLDELLGTEPVRSDDLLGLAEPATPTGQTREVTLSEPVHRVLEVRTNPVTDRGGQAIGTVASLHDVTAEREIAMMKNEFVSMVSHELRTPLTSIKGYVDLIVDGEAGEINEIQREFLTIVQENSDRLVSLINDLLDISRIESGRIHLKLEPIDVADLMADVADTFRIAAESAGISLEMKSARGLPRAKGDRDRVGQVLMNLVSNAIKYSPGGGSVTMSAARRADSVVLEVKDTGMGVAAEDIGHLFDKFYRVDNSLTREIGGTGLGLSVCKSIVELLGGRIWARSRPGQGSTFGFTLQIASEAMVRTPGVEGPAKAKGGKVLVVDHDPEIAALIETYLKKRGYEVVRAHSGREAIELAVSEAPSVITLDVILDDGDGFELLQHLKDDPRTSEIPVVVLSIVCDEGRSLRLGAADYLEKPIDQKRLVDVIGGLVGRVGSPVVLVVDDDRHVVGVLSRMLKRRGFAVAAAYNGREAMAAVEQTPPDLILLDLKMPVMDGYQVIQEVKSAEATKHIPIVVMTAHRIDRSKTEILQLAAEHIGKPFSAEKLAECVEEMLAKEGM
ncbi:MAG: hypothetical protein C0418_01280 [Coriobacteriaceae bacterium]|nr:hypothetical protein [Coriobacteriaceae bacterium]